MTPDWKKRIELEAQSNGICAEYAKLIARAETKEALISLYKRGIDWCLENDCPTLDSLRSEAKGYEGLGIFIDHHFDGELLNDQQVYVFQNCSGSIRVGLNAEKKIIPMLYFANGCDMEVRHGGVADLAVRVPLYIFGNNRVTSENSNDVQFKIYRK